MYLETRDEHIRDFNFLVEANAEAEGAKVFVDGKERGVLTASDRDDVGGANFRDRLKSGTHLIEIRKPGYKSIRQTIPMHLEAFLGVELLPEASEAEASGGS